MTKKAICVFGMGYIGLPTSALLACSGYTVTGVDINPRVVDIVNAGDVHIVEDGLLEFVSEAVSTGKLKASLSPIQSDIYIICVPTPFTLNGNKKDPNIDIVMEAANQIAPIVKEGDLVILESTSPVGTTEKIEKLFCSKNVDTSKISIAYCPERVLPGKTMIELVDNDRIVGGVTKEATELVAGFYSTFVKGKILKTDARTAEMAKLTENSFRDVNIAFANELSVICESEKIDVWELIRLANHHPRVNILQPGPGVGGHCIAVDPWFIISRSPDIAKIIKSARSVNEMKPKFVVESILEKSEKFRIKTGRSPRVACLGISYKPDIDDLRESPALSIVCKLIDCGLKIDVVEPNIKVVTGINLMSFENAMANCDFVVALVGHKEFKSAEAKRLLKRTEVLDYCGITKSE